jgi:hypothetical protein
MSWQVVLGLTLIILSAIVYFAHYLVFHDVHHIFIYLVGDIAFVFIEVLLVTLVIHQLLAEREKRAMLEKMNMVIGTFFSEVGTPLLKYIAKFDTQVNTIRNDLATTKTINHKHFMSLSKKLKRHDASLKSSIKDLVRLRTFLCGKRDFLIRLLENPILLEHGSFTNLLWAVFHLADELGHRKNLKRMGTTDHGHINGDIKRAYGLLLNEWLDYMRHLKDNYPYLFSLAMRTNPFDPKVKPEVT